MFKNILVPLDGSHTSGLGLDEAIKLAKNQKASLYLLHIIDDQVLYQGDFSGGGIYVADLLQDMIDNGKKILAKAEAKARKQHIRSNAILIENIGSPVSDVIVKQAKKVKADLIVLGTHGRRGVRRIVMGSDAEGVVRMTTVPVLLVRSTVHPVRRAAKKSRKK
jgi:nucleotide-binding universal stress UspA family protein